VPTRAYTLDATRKSDGKTVWLKKVPKMSPDVLIGQFLWSDDQQGDPRNHSIPLLEVLQDPKDPDNAIMVLPQLRRINMPRPASVRECVALVEQTLEGLVFMHENEVAHRDCAWANIMMDARAMFPKGWHPQSPTQLPNNAAMTHHIDSRTAVGGVRYYFIDFGISTRGEDSTLGFDGRERAPELSNDVPYNPYKLDVYVLGMMYQHFLVEEFAGVDFVKPLVEYMTPAIPANRPTATEAFDRFKTMKAKLSEYQLSQRLHPLKPESTPIRVMKDAYYRLCDKWWMMKPKKKLEPLV